VEEAEELEPQERPLMQLLLPMGVMVKITPLFMVQDLVQIAGILLAEEEVALMGLHMEIIPETAVLVEVAPDQRLLLLLLPQPPIPEEALAEAGSMVAMEPAEMEAKVLSLLDG
jgi:hypothetical protein